MKNCSKCGSSMRDEEQFCGVCGTKAGVNPANQQSNFTYQGSVPQQDVPSIGLNVLAFFMPMVGLILYLVWKDQLPVRAKAIGISAIWGVAIGVVLWIIMMVAMFVLRLVLMGMF